MDKGVQFRHSALVGKWFTTFAVAGILAVAATACGSDVAVTARCGSGLSCATSTVSETTSPPSQPKEIAPSTANDTSSATGQPTETPSNVTSFSRTVSENGITFTLPHELQFRTDGFTSTGEFIDGFYANIPLRSACSNGCGLSTFSPLPPKAIVIGIGALSGFGVGAPNPDDPAPNTSVAGRTAVFKVDKPGDCGGDETIKFWIPDPAHGGIGDLLIRACLTGPDLASAEQVIQTLLRSGTSNGA